MIARLVIVSIVVSSCTTDSPGQLILIACLGGAEERSMTSSIASLLSSEGHHVVLFTHGGGGGAGGGVEIVDFPLVEGDPFYAPIGQRRFIVPSQRERGLYDVISVSDSQSTNHSTPGSPEDAAANESPPLSYDAIVTSSLRLRCKQTFAQTTWVKDIFSRAKIFVTPLHFHDLCTLTLAAQFDLPVVGLVTSPAGSWWAWYHLDLLPSLATYAVPPNIMSANFGFLERMGNFLNFYSFLRHVSSVWAEPLMTSLPEAAAQPITALYRRVGAVIVAFDWLLFPELPVTSLVTPMAGARWGEEEQLEQELVAPMLANRNGVVVVSLKMEELWVGAAAQDAILDVLAAAPFTVAWRGVGKARGGVNKGNKTRGGGAAGRTSAILIQREDLPMRALLAHPRHRLLLSTCGLREASLAIVYGSPVLCLPVSSDQRLTADRLAGLGIAEVVPAEDVTPAILRDAIRNMTTNRRYRARGREVAEEYIDEPLPASDKVLHAVNKILRRPWRFKRRDTPGLSLLAQSSGDVTAAILLLLTSLGGVAVWVVTVIVRGRAWREREKKKEE